MIRIYDALQYEYWNYSGQPTLWLGKGDASILGCAHAAEAVVDVDNGDA